MSSKPNPFAKLPQEKKTSPVVTPAIIPASSPGGAPSRKISRKVSTSSDKGASTRSGNRRSNTHAPKTPAIVDTTARDRVLAFGRLKGLIDNIMDTAPFKTRQSKQRTSILKALSDLEKLV